MSEYIGFYNSHSKLALIRTKHFVSQLQRLNGGQEQFSTFKRCFFDCSLRMVPKHLIELAINRPLHSSTLPLYPVPVTSLHFDFLFHICMMVTVQLFIPKCVVKQVIAAYARHRVSLQKSELFHQSRYLWASLNF